MENLGDYGTMRLSKKNREEIHNNGLMNVIKFKVLGLFKDGVMLVNKL